MRFDEQFAHREMILGIGKFGSKVAMNKNYLSQCINNELRVFELEKPNRPEWID